jgi:hypothetical protein
MKCIRDSIFLNFTDKIRVYSLNQSLWNIKTIKNHGNLSYFHAFGNYMTVQNSSHILIFSSANNYSLAYNITKNTSYIYYCSLFYGSGYLIMARKLVNGTETELSQYDIDLNSMIVSNYLTGTNNTYMEMVHDHVFLYNYTNDIRIVKAFYFDKNYAKVGTTQCLANYTAMRVTPYGSPITGSSYSGCSKNISSLVGGYSGVPSPTANSSKDYILVENYNIYNDFNNFDGCCTGINNNNNITTNIILDNSINNNNNNNNGSNNNDNTNNGSNNDNINNGSNKDNTNNNNKINNHNNNNNETNNNNISILNTSKNINNIINNNSTNFTSHNNNINNITLNNIHLNNTINNYSNSNINNNMHDGVSNNTILINNSYNNNNN